MRTNSFLSAVGLGLFVVIVGACSAPDPTMPGSAGNGGGAGGAGDQAGSGDFVGNVQSSTSEAPRPSVSPLHGGTQIQVRGTVTLNIAAITGRTFLYGSDLQYSGINDGQTKSADSTFVIGHIPTRFIDAGDRIQLVEDQSFLFESDVNHPDRLIYELPVVSRTGTTITVAIEKGSPELAVTVSGSSALPARNAWIRSLDFVSKDNLLLIESSIEAADGTIYEFMESLFPRDKLVPAGATPISADPSIDPNAERFHLLDSGLVWTSDGQGGRMETSIAARFNVKAGDVVTWYVTSNIPDEFVPDVKAGIEGWNRYSQAMWKKDFVKFGGKLPAGVKVGDPRYNIVQWDTVQDAAAAYESQATDPLTGIQSHSMIYLPKAWFNFGVAEWTDGGLAEGKKASIKTFLEGHKFLGRGLKAGCVKDILADGSFLATDDPDTFAHELVRGTLFHEVGHAWGLGHNFKGSVTYDLKTPTTYSSSIMDYNLYDLDRASFASSSSSKGPLLEYDRQAISWLYNGGKDIKATDAYMPVCTDAQVPSSSSIGTVDPFCLQYDAGNDPTAYLTRNIDLLSTATAKVGTIDSLPTTLRRVPTLLPAASTIATLDDATAALGEYSGHIQGVLAYFTRTRVARQALDSNFWLSVFDAGSITTGAPDADVRARAYAAVDTITRFEALSPAARTALDEAVTAAGDWLVKTPAYLAVAVAQRAATKTSQLKPLSAIPAWYASSVLPAVRGRVGAALVHLPALPYAYTKSANLDYEVQAIAILERGLSTKIASKVRPISERTRYATALATFRDLDVGQAAASRVAAILQTEIAAAPDATSRQALRDLLAALGGP